MVEERISLAGINIEGLRKGDYFTPEQVAHAYGQLDPKLEERIKRFEAGELKSDPLTFAATNLVKHLEKERLAMGAPVVCRTENGGIRVLSDAEAVEYLNNQANAGLRKHKAKTHQLFNSVDASQLDEHQQRVLETNQRKHAFVLAAHQGAKGQALKMQRKGLQLPKFGEKPE